MGFLEGFDGPTNLLLRQTQERIISQEPGQTRDLGLYIIRGEMVVVIGLVEEALDQQIDWKEVRADPIGTTRHKY